jgi:CRISPR system Cascade subunit CasA
VQGQTLFETLTLNLVRYSDDEPLPRRADDRPAWEMDDPFRPERTVPRGYLDYLTWQNRRILLLQEDDAAGPVVRRLTIGPGLRLDAACLDPMKHYRIDEKRGPLPLRFREERALWRDSAALLRHRSAAFRPPQVFDWLAELAREGHLQVAQTRRTLALGMANDKAKVEFCRSERLPLPLRYLQDTLLVEALDIALDMSESVGRQLWGASRTMATLLLSPETGNEGARQPASEDLNRIMEPWGVERDYWSRLEVPFRYTMETLPENRDAALAGWQRTLRQVAWAAFGNAAEAVSANVRSLKAVVRAHDQLAAGLAQALPDGSGRS